MTRILVAWLVLILGEIGLFAQCPCHKTERGESTHWGGNQLVVLMEQKAHKRLRGIVLDPHREPMPGALIEVFTNPDYLLPDGPQTPAEKASQKRIKACRTGPDGTFCMRAKPGTYEVRVSIDTGWDVTKVCVVVDPQKGQDVPVTVEMQIGT